LVAAGCKNQYWTFIPNDEPLITANTDPEPDTPAESPKEIIFVLGIDGMD
jgi:hypothetical protein